MTESQLEVLCSIVVDYLICVHPTTLQHYYTSTVRAKKFMLINDCLYAFPGPNEKRNYWNYYVTSYDYRIFIPHRLLFNKTTMTLTDHQFAIVQQHALNALESRLF